MIGPTTNMLVNAILAVGLVGEGVFGTGERVSGLYVIVYVRSRQQSSQKGSKFPSHKQ